MKIINVRRGQFPFFERERNDERYLLKSSDSENDNKWDRADKIKINRENLQKRP